MRAQIRLFPSILKTLWVRISGIYLLSGFLLHIAVDSRAQVAANGLANAEESGDQSIPESAYLLSSYIQIESVTGNEGNAGRFLMMECIKRGLEVKVFSDKDDQFNFAASIYPLEQGLPNIIFLNHIDVVPAGDPAGWDFEPFSGEISNGIIYGRGAIDMKGMAIMQLLAMEDFSAENIGIPLKYNVTMLSVSGEEGINELGAGWVVQNYIDLLNPMVVYGEGGSGVHGVFEGAENNTVMAVSYAEKQALWLEIKWEELTSGHGSVPPVTYANKVASEDLYRILRKKPKIVLNDYSKTTFKELGKIEGGIKGFVMKNITFFKPFVNGYLRKNPLILSTLSNTITLTHMGNHEGSFNQIAQEATAQFDCRLLPGYSVSRFIEDIRKRIKDKNSQFRIITHSKGAPGSPLNEDYARLKSSLKEVYAGCMVIPVLFPAVTDNNYFRNQGIPTYGINPVSLDKDMLQSIHNNNERISIMNIENGKMVYKTLLDKIFEPKNEATVTSIKKKKNRSDE